MDCRERGSHARGVYLTHYTSRMETARVKEEEEADKNNSKRVVWNMEGRKERGHYKEKILKQGLISAKDLSIELPEGCESLYHRLD